MPVAVMDSVDPAWRVDQSLDAADVGRLRGRRRQGCAALPGVAPERGSRWLSTPRDSTAVAAGWLPGRGVASRGGEGRDRPVGGLRRALCTQPPRRGLDRGVFPVQLANDKLIAIGQLLTRESKGRRDRPIAPGLDQPAAAVRRQHGSVQLARLQAAIDAWWPAIDVLLVQRPLRSRRWTSGASRRSEPREPERFEAVERSPRVIEDQFGVSI
jgi:hypothetical protein